MASSVQFQQTVRDGVLPPLQGNLPNVPQMINANVPEHARELAHKLGEAVTGGETHTGYLATYIKTLQKNPLHVRMLTSGSLAALQEVLSSWLARDRSKNGHYFTSRVPKMALYGAFVSAPMGHFLIRVMQWFFAKRTSLTAKILQLLVSNLIVRARLDMATNMLQ